MIDNEDRDAPPTLKARVVYRGGLEEELELVNLGRGWVVRTVPLGSDVIAFGDYVTLDEGPGRRPQIFGIRDGGYRTICCRSVIPPHDSILREVQQRHWRAVWNRDGMLSFAVPAADYYMARRTVARWERAGLLRSTSGPSSRAVSA